MRVQWILNFLFVGYFVEFGECEPKEKIHFKIHVPVKVHQHGDYYSHGGKKHMVLHKHEHKHGHDHHHGHKHGHKHDADHKHKHEGKHSHKHEGKHEHKHEGKHAHKHEGKHEHKHEAKHQHKHEGKHGHKHHHDHKHLGKHEHKHKHNGKHSHKHGHKHDHHDDGHHSDDHKNIIIEPIFHKNNLYEDSPKEEYKKYNHLVETFSAPYENRERRPYSDKDNDNSYVVGSSYKVEEHDPFDTSPPPPPPKRTTTPNPFTLADQIFDVNDSLKQFESEDSGDEEEPANEANEDYREFNDNEELQDEGSEHPDHIQDYIEDAKGDLENYVDYDYTEPKIQYAEKVTLPDGEYKWNGNELDKYLEQTYGTEHHEGEYDKYLDEASTKVVRKTKPDAILQQSTSESIINPNVKPVTFPTTEKDFFSENFNFR